MMIWSLMVFRSSLVGGEAMAVGLWGKGLRSKEGRKWVKEGHGNRRLWLRPRETRSGG